MFDWFKPKEMRDFERQLKAWSAPITTINIDIDDLLNGTFLSPEFQALQERARNAYATGGEAAVHEMLKTEGKE